MRKLLMKSALFLGALGGVAWAAASGTIQYSVAVCDPNSPFRCVAPSASGTVPVTGTVTANATERATAAAPSYLEGTDNPLSGDLAGNLRTVLGAALPAGTAIIGKVGIDQTTSGTTNAVYPLATENHIGETGSNHIVIKNAMTTSNNTVTTGRSIGGLQTLSNAARVSGTVGAPGTGGFIQNISVTFADAVTGTALDVYYFDANPTGSTCTDNTTFALVNADRDKVIGIVHVSDFTSGGTPVTAQAQNLALAYDLSSSTTIYACVVARASFTIASTVNASLITQVLRD